MHAPSDDELQALRKGLRKRKLPRILDGMWCSEPGIGGLKATADGSDFLVQWVSFDQGVKSTLKSASWRDLCSNPEAERQRYEVGHVVAAVMEALGQKAADSVGHPIEGIKQAAPYREAAAEWRHWATVKAGHMLGL